MSHQHCFQCCPIDCVSLPFVVYLDRVEYDLLSLNEISNSSSQPVGSGPHRGSNDPYTGVTQVHQKNMAIYMMIHNKSKITVMKLQRKKFMVGGQHSVRDWIKGVTALGRLGTTRDRKSPATKPSALPSCLCSDAGCSV